MQNIVIANLKSPVIGFVLNILGLGFFGIDRFYKGDVKLGLLKLCFLPMFLLFAYIYDEFKDELLVTEIVLFGALLVFVALLLLFDFIAVPVGIHFDNKRKLAQIQAANLANQVPINQASQTQNAAQSVNLSSDESAIKAQSVNLSSNSTQNLAQNFANSSTNLAFANEAQNPINSSVNSAKFGEFFAKNKKIIIAFVIVLLLLIVAFEAFFKEKQNLQVQNPSLNSAANSTTNSKSTKNATNSTAANSQSTQSTQNSANLSENSVNLNVNSAQNSSLTDEQKFGKRIYLETKDLYVNLRESPSGAVLVPIYKKDFAQIRVYSFDANTNAKWLRVSYFPAGANEAIVGYIHASQIAK